MEGCLSSEPHLIVSRKALFAWQYHGAQNVEFLPATRAVEEEEEAEEVEGEATNEGAGGFAEMYQNMSQGDWQAQANWMYDHTIREFQYLSTRDNLEPRLLIDPFSRREADYPPYGYHGHIPSGYAYRPSLSHDSSS
ncbi:hypothetical protein Tco_0529191 [Tanacetum coccineum]